MKYVFQIFCMVLCLNMQGQNNPIINAFENLIGKTWVASGNWADGSIFKQEITFHGDLNQKLITTKTQGFVDKNQTTWGPRSHGVRQWDKDAEEMKFWEFDVFGDVTSGRVYQKDKSLYYEYVYGEGDNQLLLTDCWEYVNDKNYIFKVGVYEDEQWKSTYLTSKFSALPKYTGKRKELDRILEKTRAFSATYMKGDHVGVSNFYTVDGKIMPGGSKIIEGRKDIAERWKLSEGASIQNHEVHPKEINIKDDTAYDYGYYNGASVGVDGTVHPFKGKYVIIWKKVNNQWLIDIDIWNSVN